MKISVGCAFFWTLNVPANLNVFPGSIGGFFFNISSVDEPELAVFIKDKILISVNGLL